MNEAPKKIWTTDEDYEYFHARPTYVKSTQYIRADIVEEMRDVLNEIYEWTAYKETPWAIRTKAALKKLEEGSE